MTCYIIGKARITPRGISFLNLYYSCSRAIIERWYELAMVNGDRNIEIAYTPTDLSKILIMPMGTNEEPYVAEMLIRMKISCLEVEEYFTRIQHLKAVRKLKGKLED